MSPALLLALALGPLALGPLAGPGPTLDAAGAARAVAEANASYEEGRYEEAADRLAALVQDGVEHATVYYNLGCALAREGRYGAAVLALRRALLLDPGLDDARANLAWVRARLADVQPEDPPVARFGWQLAALVPPRSGLAAALLLDWLAAAALVWSSTGGRRGGSAGRWRRAAGALAVAALLLGAGPAARLYRAATDARAVVLAPRVEARSGPGDTNPVLFTLHEGFEVEIAARREGWARVAASGGLAGWVPERSLGTVRPGPDPARPFRERRRPSGDENRS